MIIGYLDPWGQNSNKELGFGGRGTPNLRRRFLVVGFIRFEHMLDQIPGAGFRSFWGAFHSYLYYFGGVPS